MSDQSVIYNAQEEQNTPRDFARPWLRHYERGVPAQLTIPDHPLTWLLDQTVSRFAGSTAFIYYGTKITYAQFTSIANRFAMGLKRLGIKPGDRVAIALPNIPQYPIAFYGALRAGAVVVPTNPLYTEREMQHQLADSGASIAVVLDMFYPVLRAIRENSALEHIIITSPTDYLPPFLQRLYPLSQIRHPHPQPPLTTKELHEDKMLHVMSVMLESHTKGGVELFDLPVYAKGDDLAVLQYTGGTTGISKGAMLTHRNLLANALQTRSWIPKTRDGEEVVLCVAPFFHSYGLTVGMNFPICCGSTMVLLPKFDTKEVVKTIHRYHPTQLPGIPTMYIAIMHGIGKYAEDLRSIKYCISGAMGLPAKVRMDWEELTGGKLVEGYGLTEASPVTHANPLNGDIRDGSIGLPIPCVDAMIMDQKTMEPAPVGTEGEIMLKGPNIMQGYWNRPNETTSIFFDGWMHTGDVGKMDEEGYFYVLDRSKDMIVASGFNVYPREVEEVLLQHPSIADAAVIGVPHEYRGETVAAVVALKPGVAPTEKTRDEIIAYCKNKLTPYKVPKLIEFRESLPKTIIGKVLKREIKATFKPL
jgi:long-chain acyl-CoA synthetase